MGASIDLRSLIAQIGSNHNQVWVHRPTSPADLWSLTLPEEEGAVQDGEEDSSISDKGEGNKGDEDDQENMY
jgi:hypothetical protein